MSDIFQELQQKNIFRPRLPERPEEYKVDVQTAQASGAPAVSPNFKADETKSRGEKAAELFESWNEAERRRTEFQDHMEAGAGLGPSMREYNFLYDMREKGMIDNDDIYKIISSRELGEYLGLDPAFVFGNYDSLWQSVSEDRENRYALPQSRMEAIRNSIQIAKNLTPMSLKGIELQNLHGQIALSSADKRAGLEEQADELWKEILTLREANEKLGRGMPTDPLSFIITSTIQSAPSTGKAIAGGIAGGVVGGGLGALVSGGAGIAAGAKIGYNLGSFVASSQEMIGLLYIDLLAAGVERDNAMKLAIVGGGLQGFIEVGLGTVAGWGKSAVKMVGGKVLSKEARAKIAGSATKKFIKKVTENGLATSIGKNVVLKTAFETVKQAGEEGIEEVLQQLVQEASLALADALQDAPVERNTWGSQEFWNEMQQSFIGGLAGGIGFGIAGIPLTAAGNISETARQTGRLKNLAITIDDKAEFRAAVKDSPLVKGLSEAQIDQVYDSQEAERQEYNQKMRAEAEHAGEQYKLASLPTLEAPGEMRRQADGRLSVNIVYPDETDSAASGTLTLIDPPTGQRMGTIDFSWDTGTNAITVENLGLSQAITNRDAVLGDMLKELSYANPEMSIAWNPNEQMNTETGVDLAALKNRLIQENPRGPGAMLQFYETGDRFTQTRAMNEDIALLARLGNTSREVASDTYEAWDAAFRGFSLDTHEMIGRMGLTTEEDLRAMAAANPEGIEAQIAERFDQGKMAAQGAGQTPAGAMVVIKQGENGGPDQILSGGEALDETMERLQAVTVLTGQANPSTLHHEWLHFMTSVVIPNSGRYRTLLEDAMGKRLEDFSAKDHEYLAENYERYLRTGEAPTPGLRALFKRIAEALKAFVRSGNVSPELRDFFDRMLAGPDAAMLDSENRQGQADSVRGRARVQTDNEQQRAFAEMTKAERIAQSDLYSQEEKAQVLFQSVEERIAALRNMEAVKVPINGITEDAARQTYSSIKQRQNKRTGQPTEFVNSSFGKIISHKGFDIRVIPILAEAYENAVFMYDEPVDTTHKVHTNFTGYSHYVAKIAIDGQPVYARFMLQNLKTKPGKTKKSQFHSVHLSYEINNNAADPRVNSDIIKTATWGASGTTDLKLQQWLNSVKSNSVPNALLYQLIGEHGAGALDQAEEATTRLDNLDIARRMEGTGEDAQTIRQATGWERGADGKWRYEIPDLAVKENPAIQWDNEYPEIGVIKLDDLIDAPALFAAYPDIKKFDVELNPHIAVHGSYSESVIQLAIKDRFRTSDPTQEERAQMDADDLQELLAEGLTEEEARKWIEKTNTMLYDRPIVDDMQIKTLIHEIQHAIQVKEGFARGSNKAYWENYQRGPSWIGERDKQIRGYANEMDRVFDSLSDEAKKIYREYNRQAIALEDEMKDGPEKSAAYASLNNRTEEKLRDEGYSTEDFDRYISAKGWRSFYSKRNEKTSASELYWRTSGEVEARNATARMGFTDRRRMETLLAQTEDVDREDQLFIQGGVQIAQSLSDSFVEPGFDILFQMTRDEVQAEALRFESWQSWMAADAFGEVMGDEAAYRLDDTAGEPQARAEIEAWYEKQWNEARVLAREAALGDDGTRTPANAEAIDPALLSEDLSSEEGGGIEDETGDLEWNPELYEEEAHGIGAGVSEWTDERTGSGEQDTGLDQAATGDRVGSEYNTVRPESIDGNTGSTQNIGGGEGRRDSGTQNGVTGPITTSEANRRFTAKLPQVVDSFVQIMGQTMRTNLAEMRVETEEDAAWREQVYWDKERIYREVHPYIRSLALRMSTGASLNDTQRRTVMSHMRRSLDSGATVYRELWTSLSGDQEFAAYAQNEVADTGVQGAAQEAARDAAGLTAFQRTRLAEQVIDKDIGRKIRRGEATSGEISDYIDRRNEEIRELGDEIKTIRTELDKSRGETAEERTEVDRWWRQYQKTAKELKAAQREAKQIRKKLETARNKAAERLKAGRERADEKLKRALADKREEIRALRQRMKDDVAHARAQGRMETGWKWAEERQRLQEKEAERKSKMADRKAAAKYLEANKKLSAWIMSADRIGMNVWVRQRELLLGIQNALFHTSETAARARQLDAEIRDVEKKIEREKKRLSRAKDDSARGAIQWQIDQYEAYRENLKSSRQNTDIMAPYLAGVKTEQAGDGTDTVDTGTIVYNGNTMSVEEFRKQFYEHKIRYGFMDSKLRKAMRRNPQSIAEKRKYSAANLARGMSQEDLMAIKAVMQQLNKEGRANWERRQFAIHYNQQELIKSFLYGLDELEEEGKTRPIKRYIKAMENSNIAEREKLLAEGTERQKLWFMTWDDKRLLQWMDGNQKRQLYKFVVQDRLRYANRRDVAINQRIEKVLDIIGQGTPEEQAAEQGLSEVIQKKKNRERAEKRMKELGVKNITIDDIGPRKAMRKWEMDTSFTMQQAETILEGATSIQVSLADLMFMAVALDNQFARSHLLYGNLWSDDERAMYESKDPREAAAYNVRIKQIGLAKEAQLRNVINQYLFEDDGKGGRKAKGDLLTIVDAIRDNFESHFPETRAIYEDMFNQAVEGQDNYLPIVITEGKHAQAEKQNEIEALTQGSYQVRISPDKGMMLARVDIGATHQTEIETDIFKVFFKGVEREEHFAKFAPYVRDLNTVLRGRNNESKQLADKLTGIYGKWAVDRLYQHINMIGLPPSAKIDSAWENAAGLGRLLAGNAGVAYIAFNVPAWLAQYPNSIAAFFGKADARFILSSCLEVLKPGGDLVERVFAKSPKVKQRVINVAEEYRQYLAEDPGKLKQLHAKAIEIGMTGQRHADQTMVAAGWWALYQTALKNGKSEEDAVVFADEITAETQPDLHALETSPMYKDPGLGRLFLRFTQPLNMVWQNLTYDSFVSREKSFGSTVARITAYGTAALIVAALRGGLAKKDGEDLDPEELMRRVFYYLVVSQFAESTPLIGNMMSGSMEKLITGEGTVYAEKYFELASRILNIPGKLTSENFEGALKDAMTALGLGVGLPVSQANRIIKAVQEENPWIVFGFNPQ